MAIFFVLSAFLLYRPFVSARLDDARRAAACAATPAAARCGSCPRTGSRASCSGSSTPPHTPDIFGDDWWVYFGLLQSWSKETIISGIGVAWSLSVEMAFYVLLPVYALLMARLLGRRDRDGQARLELMLLAASAVAAVAVRATVHAIWPTSVFGNQLSGTWTWFTGGLVLAVASAWMSPARPTARGRCGSRPSTGSRAGGSRSRA